MFDIMNTALRRLKAKSANASGFHAPNYQFTQPNLNLGPLESKFSQWGGISPFSGLNSPGYQAAMNYSPSNPAAPNASFSNNPAPNSPIMTKFTLNGLGPFQHLNSKGLL